MLEFYSNFQVKRNSSSHVLIGSANGLSRRYQNRYHGKKIFFFFFRRRISNVRALNSRVRKFHGEIIFVAGLFVGVGSLPRRFPDMINTPLFFIRKTHGVTRKCWNNLLCTCGLKHFEISSAL